jgi:hypothetical protein
VRPSLAEEAEEDDADDDDGLLSLRGDEPNMLRKRASMSGFGFAALPSSGGGGDDGVFEAKHRL